MAEEAIAEKVATPLGLGVAEAAFTVFSTVNQDMVAAIQDITIWQGVDPREYIIVAGGGAAGMHAVPIAQELGVKQIFIPKDAGTLSAMGVMVADIATEYSASHFMESNRFAYAAVNKVLESLEKRGKEFLSTSTGVSQEVNLDFFVEARYPFEVWEINIPLRGNRIKDEQELTQLVEDFHAAHERTFAVNQPGQHIECVVWRVTATVKIPEANMKEVPYGGEDPSFAMLGKRNAYFKDLKGFVETPLYRGDLLAYGNQIVAPAIIEEATSTVVIFPGSRATVTRFGSYLLEID